MYAGVEGGGTKTKVTILSKEGKVLGNSTGPHSNHWRIGVDPTIQRITDLISDAKKEAGIPEDAVLESIGMSLSGVDTIESKELIETAMKKSHPNLMKSIHVWNDSVGAIGTVSDSGGMVLIAGTGSICMYIDPDGNSHRIGGFGHMLGDEGSAYWIVHKGVKWLVDHEDGVRPLPFSISTLEKVVYDYFQIDYTGGLLEHFYTSFDKTQIAKMCVNLAKAADEGDTLCRRLFYDAGYVLARQAMAMLSKFKLKDNLKILCVGSVWGSWNLLKEGFLEGMTPKFDRDLCPGEFSLASLKVDATIGAAIMSAKETGFNIPIKYKDNYDIFYHHEK